MTFSIEFIYEELNVELNFLKPNSSKKISV